MKALIVPALLAWNCGGGVTRSDEPADGARRDGGGGEPTPDATPDARRDAQPDAAPDLPPDASPDVDTGDAAPGDGGGDGSPGCAVPSFLVRVVDPPDGYVGSFPRDIHDGTVAGYAGDEPFSPLARPLRVPLDGPVELMDVPEANWGFGHGGGGDNLAGEFAWRPQVWIGGVRTELDVPVGYGSGQGYDVNATGLVVGTFAGYDDPIPPNPIGERPCTWDGPLAMASPMATAPGSPLGAAWEVNDAGLISGAVVMDGTWIAARWSSPDAQPDLLGGLPGASLSEGLGMNDAGDVVGRSSFPDLTTHAAFYRSVEEEWVELPSLAGSYAEAFDINDDRWAVGTSSPGDGTARAVLWIDGAVHVLDDLTTVPGTVKYLSSAVAIDHAGRIAAEAVLAGGLGDLPRTIAVLTPTCP